MSLRRSTIFINRGYFCIANLLTKEGSRTNNSSKSFHFRSFATVSPASSIPVKAYYVATSIDLLKTLNSQYSDKKDKFEFLSKVIHYILLELNKIYD